MSLLAATVAFVVNILMARALGPAARGDVAWVLQWSYVMAPVIALGADRAALRNNPLGRRISSTHVWLLALVAIAVLLPARQWMAVAAVAVAAAGAAVAIERGVGIARNALRSFVGLHVSTQLWILSTSVALFALGETDVNLWLAVYALPAIGLFVHWVVARRVPSSNGRGWLRTAFVDTDARTVQYMVGGLASIMASRVERLLIPVLASSYELGLYVAVATASEMLVWVARGMGDSRVAVWVDTRHSIRGRIRLLGRDALVFFAFSIPLAAAIKWGLIPVLGPSFAAADTLIVPLCLASAAWSCYLQRSAAWLAQSSGAGSAALDSTTAVLTALSAAALIPFAGATGAAWACFAAYSVMAIAATLISPDRRRTEA